MAGDPVSETNEDRQLAQVVAELAGEFPDVPAELLASLARQAIEGYEAARVRTFLPILVAKDVRALLRSGIPCSDVPVRAGLASAATLTLEMAAGRSA